MVYFAASKETAEFVTEEQERI